MDYTTNLFSPKPKGVVIGVDKNEHNNKLTVINVVENVYHDYEDFKVCCKVEKLTAHIKSISSLKPYDG